MASDNNATYTSPLQRVDWQVAQVLWVIYFTITSYLFIALLIYLLRHRHETQIRRRRGLLMYGFVTMAFVLAIIEMSLNEWGLIHMMRDEETCEAWRQLHHLAFITSLVPGYIFLWIRQHAFYGDAMLKTMTNTPLAIFSWVVLATFFMGYGFFMAFFGSTIYTDTHDYVIKDMACFSGTHKDRSMRFYGIASALLVFYQGSLLFLFTYPIYRSSQDDSTISTTMEVIFGYLRKCRLLTFISAGTDIIAFLCSTFLKKLWNAPLHFLTSIYDIDLLINLCCLLLCLKPWKEIIMPFRKPPSKTEPIKTPRGYSYVQSQESVPQPLALRKTLSSETPLSPISTRAYPPNVRCIKEEGNDDVFV